MEKGAGRIPPPTREDGIRTTKSLESHSWLDRIVFRDRDPEIEERVIMYRVGGDNERDKLGLRTDLRNTFRQG